MGESMSENYLSPISGISKAKIQEALLKATATEADVLSGKTFYAGDTSNLRTGAYVFKPTNLEFVQTAYKAVNIAFDGTRSGTVNISYTAEEDCIVFAKVGLSYTYCSPDYIEATSFKVTVEGVSVNKNTMGSYEKEWVGLLHAGETVVARGSARASNSRGTIYGWIEYFVLS